MEPQKPGNKNMPEFKQLSDRLIAKPPSGPMLVIKTNLDPKDATEDNPYFQKDGPTDREAFLNFFEE